MPVPYFIPGRGIGGWVAHMVDYRSWSLAAGIWGGGEIMAVDVSGTSVGKCTYYTEAGGDLSIVGVSASGNESARRYGTIPATTPGTDPPEDIIAVIDLARAAVRVANDNSGAITHGDLLSAEKDDQTVEGNANVTNITTVDIAAITVLADATDATGAEIRLYQREINKILGRSNQDLAQNTADQIAIDVTLLLNRPEVVIPSA